MTIRRRGKRIKVGRNVYVNTDANGNVRSRTVRDGWSTYTSFYGGGSLSSRSTLNFGDGVSDVTVTRKIGSGTPKPKPVRRSIRPRGQRGRAGDDVLVGIVVEAAIAAAWFVAQAAWRLGAWSVAAGWRLYLERRDARRGPDA